MYVAREQQRKIGSFLFASVPSDQFVFNFHGGFGDGSAAGLRRDTPVSLGFLRQGRSTIRLLGRVHTSTAARSTAAYSGAIHLFRSPAIQGLAAEEAMATSGGGGGYEGEGAGDWEEVVLQSQSRGVLEHLNDIIVDYFAALPSRVSRASFRSSCALSRHSMEKVVAEGDAVHSTMTASGPSLGPGRTRLVRSVSEDVLGTDLGSKRVHKDSACEMLDQAKQQGDEILLKLSQVRRQVWRRRLVLLFGSALHKFVPDRSKRKSDRIHMTKDIV